VDLFISLNDESNLLLFVSLSLKNELSIKHLSTVRDILALNDLPSLLLDD